MLDRSALLAVLLASSSCAPSARVPGAAILPQESLVTLTGERMELSSVVRGRVALLSFWATWCDTCTREIDSLNRLAARTAARGDALVVGVAVGEPHNAVDTFVREHGVRYAQLVDEDFRLADALGQRDVPATLVVDREGRVVYRGDALDGSGLEAFRKTLDEVRHTAVP
jgi:peroxiredoxin